jgi:WD40 repeat protein
MRYLPSLPLSLRLIMVICLSSLFLLLPVTAQDGPPAPQFLYRNENRLILLNGYTGEMTELPIEVTDRDRFTWSPDGKYLLLRRRDAETWHECINLYDVDALEWVYAEPIACEVQDVVFSVDSTQLVYSTSDDINAILWLYNLNDKTQQEIYRTFDGDELRPSGISGIEWSPTAKYLTFEDYSWIMGGTLNSFIVMNSETLTSILVQAPNTYYASYHPIWSVDDSWFLIVLLEQYVTSGSLPLSNHEGDVYLVNSETGAEYRLTYTPASYAGNIRWTEDGKIAFTEFTRQDYSFTLEEAMSVEVVPREEIVMPEPFDADNYYNSGSSDINVSPDPNRGAWVVTTQGHDGNSIYELNFGTIMGRTVEFSIPLPESYQYNNIIIGWRPSDYPYPQG